ANHWSATWVGFDILLLVSFATTSWTAWRRSPAATAATAVTVTLLGCDAWFDMTTASTTSDLMASAITAAAGELPLAAVLIYLTRRALRPRVSVPQRSEDRPVRPLAVVTGGSGHVGVNLVRSLLTDGHAVNVVDVREPVTAIRLGASWTRADVRDARQMRTAFDGADVVYHLASVISVVGA